MSKAVIVVAYDPSWPTAFAAASRELAAAWGDAAIAIHHVGSTSVPGLDAKPVIDLLAVVTDVRAIDARDDAMRAIGYEAMGEFGIAGRRYFRRDDAAGARTHQVHAFAVGSPHVARHVAFRDFLRAHPAVAGQYAALKRSLAAAHAFDIKAYMDGKDAFIKDVESRAIAWQLRVGDDRQTE